MLMSKQQYSNKISTRRHAEEIRSRIYHFPLKLTICVYRLWLLASLKVRSVNDRMLENYYADNWTGERSRLANMIRL